MELDDLLSDNENDNYGAEGQGSSKEDDRAEKLIRHVQDTFGCTWDHAVKRLIDEPELRQKYEIRKTRMLKLDSATALGRGKIKKDIMRKVIESCPFQQEMGTLIEKMSGLKSEVQLYKKLYTWTWSPELLEIYVLFILKYEMLKMKEKYKNKGKKFLEEKELSYLRRLVKFMMNYNYDKMFLAADQDHRQYVLNCFEILLNKERNEEKKKFDEIYMRDHARILATAKQVRENYIYEYKSNPVPAGRGRGNNNSNSTAGDRARALAMGSQVTANSICIYYNTPRGCVAGSNCPLDHKCYGCFRSAHNIFNCWKIQKDMLNNGTYNRVIKFQKRGSGKRFNSDSGSSGGSTKSSTQQVPPPPPGYILGHDNRFHRLHPEENKKR